MDHPTTRRQLLGGAACFVGGLTAGKPDLAAAEDRERSARFRYSLNTSTIRGQDLPLRDTIDVVAEAGYDGIEPWIGEIRDHEKQGGTLADLRKRLDDRGLTVVSAIGFAKWIVDDAAERSKGLDQAKRDMEAVAALGGSHIAAPPAGATDGPKIDPETIAKRYVDLIQAGESIGVRPLLEIWGGVANLGRFSELLHVAVAAGHPETRLLPDVFHLYRGGARFPSLRLVSGEAMPVFHMNDYPGDRPREALEDSERLWPGDGAAPMGEILRTLHDNGFRGYLSLELFNRAYWKWPAKETASTGLEKMRAAVSAAASE